MKYNPEIHHRRSIRLKGYDYTQPGAYFVTFCAYQRMHLFGELVDGSMILKDRGKIARDEWFKTAELRPYVKLYEDEFVIMPNHGHAVIWIEDESPVRARRRRAPTLRIPTDNIEKFGKPVKGSIPTIVRAYKSAVTYAVNKLENQRGAVLWQKNYGACLELVEGSTSSAMTENCITLRGIFLTIPSTGNWIVTTPRTRGNCPRLKRWTNI